MKAHVLVQHALLGVALEVGLLGLVLLLERLQLRGLGQGVHVQPLGARLPREHLTLGVAHGVAGDADEVVAGELDLVLGLAGVLGGNSIELGHFWAAFWATFWDTFRAIFCPTELGMELQ